MKTSNSNLEIDTPEPMHKLCQAIIGKYAIATIRDKDEPPIPEEIIRRERSIHGHVLRLQYAVEQSKYHLSRFNVSLVEKVEGAEKDLLWKVQHGSLPPAVLQATYFPTAIGCSYGGNPIFFELDATLSSLVRAGNRLVKLINAIRPLEGVQSKSLHAFVSTIGNHSPRDELDEIILKYWDDCGERIKDYRDMIEHNEHINKDFTFLIRVSPLGESVPSLLLPDNPKDKSLEKLRYDYEINAYNFLNDAYNQTVKCIENVLPHLRKMAIEEVSTLKPNLKPTS